MSGGNLVKNNRKKPQRNLQCKETRKCVGRLPEEMSFSWN